MSLSRTYIKGDIDSAMPICPTVKLEKDEDSYALTMINEGENIWFYSAMVPSVEVLNQGVWMELYTYLGDPATLTGVLPGERKEIEVLKKAEEIYPYFAPGIYRVVIYGGDDTCIVTENFTVSGY